ncbi:N-acetyltransferase family protein [Reinekea marina]|nr:GNAT family N-acetyltransferase [Reinekea marina]MDN3647677.1 N-acetyltransferase family protein [Reinekea marina]
MSITGLTNLRNPFLRLYMHPKVTIRHIEEKDLSAVVSILNPFIEDTAVTFDTLPYSTETRLPWFNQFGHSGRHQCLVAEVDSKVVAYANSGPLRPKAAYDTSVEVSIYKASNVNHKGLGSVLYEALFDRLEKEDVHRAHALITLPNSASIGLHKKMGFYEVGILNEAGRKFDQYHDVLWMEMKLRK